MISIRHGSSPQAQASQQQLEAAIARYAESGSPEDHAEALRLYEVVSRFKAGCGVCIAGRKMFIEGMAALAKGEGSTALAKLRGAVKSVRLKLDILRG